VPNARTGVAAVRRIAAAGFLFAGVFVMCFGLGNSRRAVFLAGLALAILAIGAQLALRIRRNPRQWTRGIGYVVAAGDPPQTEARFGRCEIQLVVDAPGLPQDTVTIYDSRVPVALWPRPGQELPIQVAADDPRRVRVLWRSVAANGAEPAGPVGLAAMAGPLDLAVPADDWPARSAAADDDTGIDFDLDGPPTLTLAPPPGAEPPPVPRSRPSPHPRRASEPVPAGAALSTAGATAGAATGATAGAATGATAGATARAGQVSSLVTTYPSAHPGPAGAINGVGVTVLVSDLDRSVAFYRDQLGFYEVDGGEGSTVLASGETRLVLRQAPDLGTVNRRLVHLNLEVAEIEAMYDELKAAGIRFLYPPRAVSRSARLELWAAAFRDPDGHGIALTQWRPRTG
jgi:catechol 2,3-dioxygenase-like lactoylglutathione lyase family enzyme